jgi:hypothetical protein
MAECRNILDDFKVNHEEKTIDTSVKLKVGIIGCASCLTADPSYNVKGW